MFNLDLVIAEWRRQMEAAGVKSSEVLNELESHLRDDVEQQVLTGMSQQQAFKAAVERMGRTQALKREFEKVGGTMAVLRRKLKGILGWFAGVPLPPLGAFSPDGQRTLELAREEAPRLHHCFIGTEHVLLGLLGSETGAVLNVLRKLGLDREIVRIEIEKIVGLGPEQKMAGDIPFTPRARKALRLAAKEARALNRSRVGAEHIFLGLLLESEGVAGLVLRSLGVDVARARRELLKELGPN